MSLLGDLLKTEREKKGIRIADIASVTKIPPHNLKLIEEGKWKALPPNPFIKGFLVSYCKYVGLNPNEIYQKYLAEVEPDLKLEIPEPSSEPQEKPERSREPEVEASVIIANPKVIPIKKIALSFTGAVVLVLLVWLIQVGKNSSTETPIASNDSVESVEREVASTPDTSVVPPSPTESVPTEAPATAASAEPVNPPPTPTPAPELAKSEPARATPTPNKEGQKLDVQVKERSWAKIVIDDAPPVEFHLKAEEKTTFTAKEKIKLVLGNSTGAEVFYNGQNVPGVKYQGTIRYFIFPAGSKFPQDKTARKVASEPQFADQPAEAGMEESSEE